MEDYIKELVRLAYKTSPVETEYYFNKYIRELDSKITDVRSQRDNLDMYEMEEPLNHQLHKLERSTNSFKMHLTCLRLG